MQKRFIFIVILILCVFFTQGCGLFDPCFKSFSSGFLDADNDIPKRIGIIRFQVFDPTNNIVNDEFSKHLKKLNFDVVETDEYRGAIDSNYCCGPQRVKMEKIRDLSNFYNSDYYKEFRDMLKEKFNVEAIFVGTCFRNGYICVDLIDIKTGRIIWTGGFGPPLFDFNPFISTTRRIKRQLENDIESHNQARKTKAK